MEYKDGGGAGDAVAVMEGDGFAVTEEFVTAVGGVFCSREEAECTFRTHPDGEVAAGEAEIRRPYGDGCLGRAVCGHSAHRIVSMFQGECAAVVLGRN